MAMKGSKFAVVVAYVVVLMFDLFGIAKVVEAPTPNPITSMTSMEFVPFVSLFPMKILCTWWDKLIFQNQISFKKCGALQFEILG